MTQSQPRRPQLIQHGFSQAVKLSKYDVTGVGINLVISDAGEVKVGSVPPPESDAASLGISFGDRVLSINGKDCDGMTSFDALEAIQSDSPTVTMRIEPNAGGAAREVSLTKSFTTRDPVSTLFVSGEQGKVVGYIKLKEFNAQCKRRVKEALLMLQAAGATELVVDLRGNVGGVLDGALGIAGFFLEKPLVRRLAGGGRGGLC